jgi:hypothetical protein
MEVIPSTAGGSGAMPFQRHNVEEWSRLDSLTGMLEHARVETGHWAASTSNSSQQYGKVRKFLSTLPTITNLPCPANRVKHLLHWRVSVSIAMMVWTKLRNVMKRGMNILSLQAIPPLYS